MNMRTIYNISFLISTVFAASSFTVDLHRYNESTPSQVPGVLDNSKIYLASIDKALPLSRITLTTKGTSITLDKLLGNIDDYGFKNGWPVSSDLTITSTNTQDVTKELKGYLFVATPTMSQDPNFMVRVVRNTATLDRSSNDASTIVFLSVYVPNNATVPYMGFTHTRITNIVQPKTTSLTLYRAEPDDSYVDLQNVESIKRRIFSNPLRISNSDTTKTMFFDNIDPIQYSLQIWMLRAVGGITLDVSDVYVDTTSVQSSSATVTGMAISQVFTYNSSVTFMSSGNNMGLSGVMMATDLFDGQNVTCVLNGKTDSSTVTDIISYDSDNLSVFGFPAENLQIIPSRGVSGSYFIQYFKIDNGPAPSTTPGSTVITTTAGGQTGTSNGGQTGAPATNPTSQSTAAPPSTSTQYIQTTTKSVASSFTILPLFVIILKSFVLV